MELQVFSQDIELLGILDSFQTLQWTSRYYTSGDFELVMPYTQAARELLCRGNLLRLGNRSGYLHSIALEMGDGGETITATGCDLTHYLARRINWQILTYSGTAAGFMGKLVSDNCIEAAAERVIPRLELGLLPDSPILHKQNSYGNLLEVLEEVARAAGLGYRIQLEPKGRKLIFQVYQGEDHTVGQTALPPVILSRDFENLLEMAYVESEANYANTALIAGAGEGEARKKAAIQEGSGLGRYEIFVDANDLQPTAEGGELTSEEYTALLLQRGQERLRDYCMSQSFDSVLFGTDVALGDLVTVTDKRWGITCTCRVTELEETFENGGCLRNVILGDGVPTQYEKLRKGMR